MSIAIHLSVYLRYLDSRPLLQYIIEDLVIFKHSIVFMAVRIAIHLSTR